MNIATPLKAGQNDSDTKQLNHQLLYGLILSVVVHIVLALALTQPAMPKFEQPIMVEFVTERSIAPSQIVSTPEVKASSEPPPDTRLESDINARTDKEQIRRGDPLAGAAVGERQMAVQASRPAAEKKPNSSTAEPKIKQQPPQKTERQSPLRELRLDPGTVQRSFAAPKEPVKPENPLLDTTTSSIAHYAPFSRPSGSGARFLGSQGSSDYLPSLPDGDITLLNAKANQYAVFVRRVATQVFAELRSQGWEMLHGADIRAATRFSVVRAILSPKGDLESVVIESSSGSQRFDRILQSSARAGARDANPPAGARASDGRIHFIFQARSWAEVVSEPRTGFPMERRWLLLGTGLD